MNKTFLLLTGFACNNNCVFCSSIKRHEYNSSQMEIMSDIKKFYNKGYTVLEFTGGESTIRKDFLYLISYAKNLGYSSIGVITNGRLFSYQNFTKDAVKAGINYVVFSVYGHNANLHNCVTRVPNSFEQCIKGIKNALACGLNVKVNTVICKFNYRYIKEMGLFINNLGIKSWRILELLLNDWGDQVYKNYCVNLKHLSNELNKINEVARFFNSISLFDFPFCIFEPTIFKTTNVNFITAKVRYKNLRQYDTDNPGTRIIKKMVGSRILYKDKYKIKPKICESCKYFFECSGVAKPYFKIYGDKEIKELFKKYNLKRA